MKELISCTINTIELDKNKQHYLRFNTDSGAILYQTEGDCCSETWFADLIGVDYLLNAKVTTVEEIQREEVIDSDAGYGQRTIKNYNLNDGRGRQDYDQVYGYKITTNKGTADIIFRNSSNGYYGGYINYVKEVWEKNVEFMDITKDYPN